MWSPIAWAKASDAMRWTHLSLYSLATYPPIAGSIVGLGAMLTVVGFYLDRRSVPAS